MLQGVTTKLNPPPSTSPKDDTNMFCLFFLCFYIAYSGKNKRTISSKSCYLTGSGTSGRSRKARLRFAPPAAAAANAPWDVAANGADRARTAPTAAAARSCGTAKAKGAGALRAPERRYLRELDLLP